MKKNILTNKQYDILVWIVGVVFPSLIMFLSVVFETLQVENGMNIITIATAFNMFLGTVFGISKAQYNKFDNE